MSIAEQRIIVLSPEHLPLSSIAVSPTTDAVKTSIASPRKSRRSKWLIVLTLGFFLLIVTKDAWLSDDAYITFRTVDNFVHGYGLTWNIDERVQTYTHPLWMFLLSALYFCTHHIYYSSLFVSLFLSLLAAALFAFVLARSPVLAALGLVTLAASKAFVDFSTSGLENSLTHLLLIQFLLAFYSAQRRHFSQRSIFWLALLAALIALNRMDTILLFVPALLYVLYKTPRLVTIRTMLLGFAPFLLWEMFSLWYYGFLFPNTAYAKLITGIPTMQLLPHGLGYLLSSFIFDPLPLLIIAAGLVLPLLMREWSSLPFILGIALYLLYTLKVGGDFMAGRFLTAPFLIALILLSRCPLPSHKGLWIPTLTVLVFLGLFIPNSRWYPIFTSKVSIDIRGITDERATYIDATGIFNVAPGTELPNSSWVQAGLQAKLSNQRVVVQQYSIGFFGFAAGHKIHIIDLPALADPLLARLPALPKWRIGHFYRHLPDGYLETLQSGNNLIRSKDLALYYSKLSYVTRGPLFDLQRLIEIWKLNTGAYNYLLKEYNTEHPVQTPMIPLRQTGYIFYWWLRETLVRRLLPFTLPT